MKRATSSHRPVPAFSLLMAAAAMTAIVAASPAAAADACKVKVNKKTGVISLAATNTGGLIGWRDGNSDQAHAFDYDACVIDGDDVVCPLSEPGTALATMPPPSCTVCIEDGTGKDCCARIKNCTPGVRDCVRVNEVEEMDASSYGAADALCPVGYKVQGGGASSSDFFDLQQLSVSRPNFNGNGWHCEGFNHNGVFPGSLGCYAICCRQP
ncbi:MAG TPA: hypothetical protein VEL28_12465 [Candidatus Binatia bacterium]|nr:hypothetical protein [Candidatus Binatia bacterium]